jgi:hypothetical protein
MGTSKKEKSARDDALTDATVKTPRAGALSMLLLFVRALHRTKRERNAAVRSPKTSARQWRLNCRPEPIG